MVTSTKSTIGPQANLQLAATGTISTPSTVLWAAGLTPLSDDTKPDTRLRSTSGSLEVDLSQRLTDLTASGSGAYETTSARTAIDSPLSVEIFFTADNGDTGILVSHGDTGDTAHGYRIEIDGSSNVVVSDTSNTIFSEALPSVAAGSKTYGVMLSVEPNDLTTGASDAYRFELTIYNVDDDEWALHQASSAVLPVSATHAFAVGGRYNGATLSEAYSGTITELRVGRRFHTSTEFREDWVAQSTPGAVSSMLPSPELTADAASTIGDDGNAAGPVYALSTLAHRMNSTRLLSPLLNMLAVSPPDRWDDAPLSWYITVDAGSPAWGARLGQIVRRRIPLGINRVRVRAHFRSWEVEPPFDATNDVRCYSRDMRPGTFALQGQQATSYYVEAVLSNDHTSTGVGQYYFESDLRIARDPEGFSYFFLAWPQVSAGDNRHELWAWHIEPVIVEPGSGQGLEYSNG